MTFQDRNDREQELQHREKELQDRELTIRMRELEAEIQAKSQAQSQTNDAPLPPFYSPNSDKISIKHRFKQFLKVSKIVGFTILGLTIAFVGIFVGVWLVYVAILGGIGWISYQILFGNNRSNRP
jgi:hypothetical protein